MSESRKSWGQWGKEMIFSLKYDSMWQKPENLTTSDDDFDKKTNQIKEGKSVLVVRAEQVPKDETGLNEILTKGFSAKNPGATTSVALHRAGFSSKFVSFSGSPNVSALFGSKGPHGAIEDEKEFNLYMAKVKKGEGPSLIDRNPELNKEQEVTAEPKDCEVIAFARCKVREIAPAKKAAVCSPFFHKPELSDEDMTKFKKAAGVAQNLGRFKS